MAEAVAAGWSWEDYVKDTRTPWVARLACKSSPHHLHGFFLFQFSYQHTFIVQSSGFYGENFIQVHHVCVDTHVKRETWPAESEILIIIIPPIHMTQGQVKLVKN